MKLSVIAEALSQKTNKDIDIKNVLIDSRRVERGSVFVAIKGENFDGHDFLKDAEKNGAIALVSENEIQADIPVFLVKNTREALLQIAGAYREYYHPKMVAVTGSVGKTSTKEILYSVLSEAGKCLKNEANLNNEIGVALTLLNLDESYKYAVVEMGMSNAGEIDFYAKHTHPDLAIITNIGTSHIGNLGSRDAIFAAKTEILPYIKEKTVVVCGDDDYLPKLKSSYENVICYGRKAENEIVLLESKRNGFYECSSKNERYEFEVGISGEHNALNALSAIAVGQYLGIDKKDILSGLKKASSTGSRMRSICVENLRIIDDTYNASPESIKAALNYLDSLKLDGKIVCAVLGDVFEMGDFAKEGHKKIGSLASASKADTCVFIGNNAKYAYEEAKKNLDKNCYYYKTKAELFKNIEILSGYDIILLKASRGMAFEEILERIKDVYTSI